MPNPLHAQEFVRYFIAKDRRKRYQALLEGKDGERVFAAELAHLDAFTPAYAQEVPPGRPDQQIAYITRFVAQYYPSRTCYVISEQRALSEQEMAIAEALEAIVGAPFGTILSFIPGRLAYYEGESVKTRLLLFRPFK
ncbi:hypothetical protein I2I05_21475 [Hymenobacter sp. BT683]|uniref:Uncharacterized protein n=1 Tax=Hymenobacter jeongseonensis TaxID=2791027 RepID=A0ABS0INN8_9BACT|nr:hypothetical protein [Hymenobacter jeongseonensis]MBF9239976.1 hypothetical protein [Hymenobacter jeongseonensis]